MATEHIKVERHILKDGKYQLLSQYTNSESVEMNDGTDLETKMSEVDKNISDEIDRAKNAESTLDTNKVDKTTVAASSTLGLVKSGTDITVDSSGNVSVNDNSHKHTVSNISDLTATASELNIMDGVTVTTEEINKLDGLTATTNELNYVDGVTSNIQTQLNAKAPLASPTLTGTPKAPTATSGTNTTQIATTAFVQAAVSSLVDSAPETLNTLNELSAALGDDPNFATTVATQIGSIESDVTDIVDGTTVVAEAEKVNGHTVETDVPSDAVFTDTVTTVSTTGSGNAITALSASNGKITATKGSTFLTKHPTITVSTDTTSSISPSAGDTFTTVDSVVRDANGHVIQINTKDVTLPNTSVVVDNELSETSENPVKNKVVTETINAVKNTTADVITNEINWVKYSSDMSYTFDKILYGNNTFVAITGNWEPIYYSTDGTTWAETALTDGSNKYIYDFTFGNNKFVLCRHYYDENYEKITDIFYSTDAITWTKSVSLSSFHGTVLNYINGKFYCYGDREYNADVNYYGYKSYYSTDGIVWTSGDFYTQYVKDIIYGKNKYVGVNNGILSHSDDGFVWTECTITNGIDGGISGITYGNNKFVAAVSNNLILYSDDGITWFKGSKIEENTYSRLYSITYGNSKFIATGLYNDLFIGNFETLNTSKKVVDAVSDLSCQIQKIASHVGQVIHSTTLDTMEKVIAIYGGTTWEKIEGMFLLGQSSSYAINSTGGSATVTLTKENLPSHTHSTVATATGNQSANHTHTVNGGSTTISSSGAHTHTAKYQADATNSGSAYRFSTNSSASTTTAHIVSSGDHTHTVPAHTHTVGIQSASHTHTLPAMTTTATGSGTAHNNMPPYKTVYIWERTA